MTVTAGFCRCTRRRGGILTVVSWRGSTGSCDGCSASTSPSTTPAGAGVASRGGGAPLQLLLLNRAPFPVTLAFVDATGEEVALRTLRVREHAEYETLATHAWRVRTLGGHLLVEVAPGDLTAPPAAESGGVVTVYVNECQW